MISYEERYRKATEIFEQGLKNVRTRPIPLNQKFNPGTFVYHKRHKLPARIECTYAHAYWGDNIKSYSLTIRYPSGWSSSAWHDESLLTKITDPETIEKYKKELKNHDKQDQTP